jgi:hypothetical protein
MSTLFIGNATRQNYDCRYRELESNVIRMQQIRPGSQKRLTGDLNQPQIDHIISQLAKYGLVAEDRIDQSRELHGICYSVDRPIAAVRLQYLMDANMRQLIKLGEEIRRVNAVALATNVNNTMTAAEQPPVETVEVTVQQENQDPGNDVPQLSEGHLISRAPAPRPVSGRGKRAA